MGPPSFLLVYDVLFMCVVYFLENAKPQKREERRDVAHLDGFDMYFAVFTWMSALFLQILRVRLSTIPHPTVPFFL